MKDEIHVACSKLTNTIYAGKVLKKKGIWAEGKQDVTLEALLAVVDHVTAFGKPVELRDKEGKLIHRIIVE